MTHLLVDNGHYSCAKAHSNNHALNEELMYADGLDHCYHKENSCIHVALPLVFWCVKMNKLDDESVVEGNKHFLTTNVLTTPFPILLLTTHLSPSNPATVPILATHFKICGLTNVKRSLNSLKTPPRKKAPPNALVRAHIREGEPFLSSA